MNYNKQYSIAAILRLYNYACKKLNKARNEINEPDIIRFKAVKMALHGFDTEYHKECARHGFKSFL